MRDPVIRFCRRPMAAPLFFAAVSVVACAKLTTPPAPEPIVSETAAPAAPPPDIKPVAAAASASQQPAPQPDVPAIDVKVQITDVVKGSGPEVKLGDIATVHYVGTLVNGTKFDASRDRRAPDGGAPLPYEFQVGAKMVIDGWDKGVPGMKVGGKRKLVVPWQLAYGERGRPPFIGPKADLLFDIELLKIAPPPRH